ncbi:MAG: cobyrinate a,c-diamide synthase [Calditerrivibrio sp.]|nr:cobyrinate a,c-diamide synthase [Calditerrivibrio sp.]
MKSAFMIVAPHTSSGKTTLSLGLARNIAKKGLSVQPYKVGPDYIDTALLSKAASNEAYNLDNILMKDEDITKYLTYGIAKNDVVIVEGVMGFFDSYDPCNFSGSSYDIALKTDLPLLVTINYSPSLTYYTLIIKGIQSFYKQNPPKIGVIINKATSPKMDERIAQSLKYHTGAELLGVLPEDEKIKIPKRHLGLLSAWEGLEDLLNNLSNYLQSHLDMEDIMEYFRIDSISYDYPSSEKNKPKKRCLVAKDDAFFFYYKNNFDLLKEHGYEISAFSPLNDEEIPDTELIYIGGGYPELFADKLSKNRTTIASLKKHLKRQTPIYAECGGFIYLGNSLKIDDTHYPMAGLFNIDFEMTRSLQCLGYVNVSFDQSSCFFEKGRVYIGHQFRYSKIAHHNEKLIATVDRLGKKVTFQDGCTKGNCFGSYTHFNFSKANILEKIDRG